MQVVGSPCGACKTRVTIASEATWCATCKTIVHVECLDRAQRICSGCNAAFNAPHQHFAFSELCPACGASNVPQGERCASCGARTHWDTKVEYDRFVLEMKRDASKTAFRAIAAFGGAFFCLAALGALVGFMRPSFGVVTTLVIGFTALGTVAVKKLALAKRLRRFR